MKIESHSNPFIKELIRLKKSHEAKEKGLFLVDGKREIEIAAAAGWKIESLIVCPELAAGKIMLSDEPAKSVSVSEAIFEQICYKESPDGYLATVKRRKFPLNEIETGKEELIVILERVEKPGNLGAILRSAYAAGATLVIINDNQTDLFNPNVVRASEGQIFNLPLAIADRADTVEWLKKNRIVSVAAVTGSSKNYTDVDFKKSCAIVLGSEADGLSQDWIEAADQRVKIPMRSGIDSLNVSVAAALMLFEAARQRAV